MGLSFTYSLLLETVLCGLLLSFSYFGLGIVGARAAPAMSEPKLHHYAPQSGVMLGSASQGNETFTRLEAGLAVLLLALSVAAAWLWRSLRRCRSLAKYEADEAAGRAANLERELRRAQEFITHLNHELRNPLNQVIGEQQLAARGGHARLEAQMRSVRRLAWRLDGLNRHYELTSGHWVAVKENVEIEPWLEAQFQGLDLSELPGNVRFRTRIDNRDGAREVLLPANDVRAALRQLVSNAVRFTRHGAIDVLARIEGGQLLLRVSDTGCGFSTEHMTNEGLSFYQADRSRTKIYQGLGVGLAICHETAKRLGGRFETRSRIDEGTTVEFWTPYEPGSQQNDRQSERTISAMTQPVRQSPRVLVVDDDEANLDYLVHLCQEQGWAPEVAIDGEHAVSKASRKEYDVVLMDGAMPRMDGFEATRQIRKLEQAEERRRSVIVATTALCSPADLRLFKESGADSVITKPYEQSELVALVRMHLNA